MNSAIYFLETLYREDAPGYLAMWTSRDRRTRWIPARDLAGAAEAAVKLGEKTDTYFGIGLHPGPLGENRRGEAAGVIAVPGLWADIDVKGEAHKGANLPPDGKAAMKIIQSIPLEPTAIVHSGHGLQVWWLFKELWIFDGDEERRRARDLSRRFQATLKAKAKEHGWSVDGTHDLARVLRLPGTYNHKLPRRVEVKVLRTNEDSRYSPEDFEPYLIDMGPGEERPKVNFKANGHDPEGARAVVELIRDRLSGRILRAMEQGPEAYEPRPGGDGSTSGADASVCSALIGAGLTDSQIRQIYRAFPIGTRGKYAERGDEYLARTIGEMRAWLEAHGEGAQTEWEDPVPLPEGLPPVAAFDAEMLPAPLRAWVMDVAERMQIPPDFSAAGAVVVAGSLIGRKVGIYPKCHDDWLVVPNLWGAAVGRPAMLKSPALAEITKPLERLVTEARGAHEEAVAAHTQSVAIAQALQKAAKNDLEKAAKTGDHKKMEEIARRLGENETPEEPKQRRYKTQDPTTEKLCELLIDNPQGLLVYRDELSGWLRSLDKQGRESDRSLYLESWNGTGSYEVDRIGRGSLYIPALCVSILGGIQPGPLSSYVWNATDGGEGNDGLLQRFQLLVWPDPPTTYRNVDRYPNTQDKNRAYEVFKALGALTPEQAGATARDEGEIPALRFTPEAQREFDAWRVKLEKRLRSGELSAPLEAHLAKYRSLLPSLALIFHLVEVVDGQESGAVDLEAFLRAEAWCEYLESHAHRLYSCTEDPAIEGARRLLEKIRAGEVKDGSTVRGVYRGRHWSGLTTPEEAEGAANVLESYGWLRVETLKTGGRPTRRLRLHPDLKGRA